MSDDRLRVPQDPDYFHAVGLATIAFARLEWDAVWCCNRLQPGYIDSIEPKKKTAGKIADDLEMDVSSGFRPGAPGQDSSVRS